MMVTWARPMVGEDGEKWTHWEHILEIDLQALWFWTRGMGERVESSTAFRLWVLSNVVDWWRLHLLKTNQTQFQQSMELGGRGALMREREGTWTWLTPSPGLLIPGSSRTFTPPSSQFSPFSSDKSRQPDLPALVTASECLVLSFGSCLWLALSKPICHPQRWGVLVPPVQANKCLMTGRQAGTDTHAHAYTCHSATQKNLATFPLEPSCATAPCKICWSGRGSSSWRTK